MEILIYIISFSIGAIIGSFCTLAVYRIPLNKDITHERSFCPKCEHKLGFFDLIPIFSYLFLGGKCRYCKEVIRIRYFLIEILTGTIFLLFITSLNIDIYNIDYFKIIYMAFIVLYLTTIIIIAGIDKEKREIRKRNIIIWYNISCLLYHIFIYTRKH